MDIPRMDVLPDSSPTDSDSDISQETKLPANDDKRVAESGQAPKGSQTPDTRLYAALEEERRLRKMEAEKRRELEQKLKELELSSALSELDEDDLSDEGKALKKELHATQQRLKDFERQQAEKELYTQFPQLKDKQDEFETYRASYPGVALDKVARLFLSENNLIEVTPPRKGLEKPTSGNKPQTKSGYSPEDIDALRVNQPRKFLKLLQSGEFDGFISEGF